MTMTDAVAPPPRQAPSRRRAAWLILLAVVALIGGGYLLNGSPVDLKGGPLTTNDTEGNEGNGMNSRPLGTSVCYGYAQLLNPGTKDATIKSVKVEGGEGLTIGAVTILGADRGEFLYATADTCPSGGAPAKGYKLPPSSKTARPNYGVELLIPLRLSEEGEHRITGVTVTYEYDGHTYTVQQGSDMQLCTTACEIKSL